MNQNEDLITVTVPVYNVEDHLDHCIKSILNQSYKKIELILVNDGSTDSSLEICKNYMWDNRVTIINKDNEGLSSARQVGLDNSQGKYICFIDSDDYIEEEFIKDMYYKINAEKSDICVCSSRFYGNNIDKVYGFTEENEKTFNITKQDIEENYYSLLYRYYMSDSWNKMYRLKFIRESKVRFSLPKKFNGTDLSFNHRLMLYMPRISVINKPLYNHQILKNSRVRRKNKQLQKGFMIIMTQIIDEVKKLNYSRQINKQLNLLYIKFLRESAQDIYNNFIDYKQLKRELIYFQDTNQQYLKSQDIINLDIKIIESKSHKFFYWALKDRSNRRLIIYLMLRKFKSILRKLYE